MGAEEARLFTREGATVVIGDVLEDEGRKLEAELNDAGAEALFLRASRLPRIEIHKPDAAVGTSTVGSMQSGLYYGYIGLVDGIIERMKSELGEVQVIATGGLAPLISAESRHIQKVEKDLTLMGLREFYSQQFQEIDH